MKIRATSHCKRGFSLVEVLVILAVGIVVAAVMLPMLARAQLRPKRINCVIHLKQIGLAFRIFSGDNGDKYPMSLSKTNGGTIEYVESGFALPHFRVMSNELSTPKILICPADFERTNRMAPDFSSAMSDRNLSYFVGLDADETKPERILSGDRNLTANGRPVGRRLVLLSTNTLAGWSTNLHNTWGNLCLSDGSVQQVDARRTQEALAATGLATNRLAAP